MPEALKRKLRATARKRGYGKERTARYVYGTLQNLEGMSVHIVERRNRRKSIAIKY